VVPSPSRRNTIIIALAAVASIAASIAGYYAAEAQKYYALTNAELTTTLRYERLADEQARQDEELLIQATIEYHRNETRIGDFLVSEVSQEAKDYVVFNEQNNTFVLAPGYYEKLFENYSHSEQADHDYLEHAEMSDQYSKSFIILTSVLTGAVVIFSELSRKRENNVSRQL